MKQKFYSESLDKYFDSEKECLEAEKEFISEKNKIEKNEVLNEGQTASQLAKERLNKKELSKEIELADNKLSEANRLYDIAKEKASKIISDANKQAKEILDIAKDEVRKASEEKFSAIAKWNNKFGTYTTTVTGEKAAEELRRTFNQFDDYFSKFFKFWF